MLQALFTIAVVESALLAAAVLVLLALRRSDSRIQMRVCVVAIAWLLCAPLVLTIWARPLQEAARPVPVVAQATFSSPASGQAGTPIETKSEVPASLPPTAVTKKGTDIWPDLLTFASVVWILGTAFGFVRLGSAIRGQRRLATLPGIAPSERVAAAAARAHSFVGGPPAELKVVASAIAPHSHSGGRGTVVLSERVVSALSDAALESVIVHELVHVREHHHALAKAQGLLRASFWWNPLVHLLDRVVDAVKEELCDDRVLARGGDARAYAHCLLQVAELELDSKPALAAGILPLGTRFEDRVQRLLRTGLPQLAAPISRKKCVAALSALAIASVPSLLLPSCLPMLPQPERQGPSSRTSQPIQCNDLFPYAENAAWEYACGDPTTQDRKHETHTVVGEVRVGDTKCWEVRIRRQYVGWEYVGQRGDGWYRYANRYLGDMRGVEARDPELLLACPLGVALRWEWEDLMSVQVSAGPDGKAQTPTDTQLRTKHRVTLDAMDAQVTVPAGTFKAVKTTEKVIGEYYGEGETVRWFVPGIGLVRVLERHRTWQQELVRELVKFTPGAPARPFEAEAILRRHLASGSSAAASAGITWYDQEPFQRWFKARFARVAGSAMPFRVTRAGAESFDPRSPAAWSRASQAESHDFGAGSRSTQMVEELTRCVALMVAGMQGDDPTFELLPGGALSKVTSDQRSTTGEIAVRSGSWRALVRLSVENGEIVRTEVEPRR